MEELYKRYSKNKDKLFSLFIHKWAGKGFIAWIVTAIIFQVNVYELLIMLGITIIYVTWMIRAECKRYKRWLNSKRRKSK